MSRASTLTDSLLVVDNYDSFTFNLVEAFSRQGFASVVRKNDEITPEEASQYAGIVLSPGPGIPSEAGAMLSVIRYCATTTPILGVCLGHQGIAEVFGGSLLPAPEIVHGEAREIIVTDPDDPLFDLMPQRFLAGRYHSWTVAPEELPPALIVSARSNDGLIMALRHRQLPVWGVQFHPESVLTPLGDQLLINWLLQIPAFSQHVLPAKEGCHELLNV